ncbi:hypothetical protein GGI35DRAFT_437965, partial [Trichoderma velutinum]
MLIWSDMASYVARSMLLASFVLRYLMQCLVCKQLSWIIKLWLLVTSFAAESPFLLSLGLLMYLLIQLSCLEITSECSPVLGQNAGIY